MKIQIRRSEKTFFWLMITFILTGLFFIKPILMPSTILHVEAATMNGWEQRGNDWYYYQNGTAVTGWQQINGYYYYFDPNIGNMKTGWLFVGGYWYYLNPNDGKIPQGAMLTGWQQINGKWFFLTTNTGGTPPQGAMVTGWLYWKGDWYFLDSSGAMVTGWYYTNRWYYFHDDGTMASDEWETDSSGEPYFFTPDGGFKQWSTLPAGNKDYTMESGRELVYDVYSTTYNGKGFQITTINGKQYLQFKGWSMLFGYKTHTATNNETYIIAENVNNPKKIFGYNTKQMNWSATEDVEYNKYLSTDTTVWNECPDGATNKNNTECNFRYDNVGFEASIPLDDLFPDGSKPDEWKLYIVKRVDDAVYWDYLRLPFTLSAQNYKQGKVNLESKVDTNVLVMNGTNVIKRQYPNQSDATGATFGYFNTGTHYTKVASNESNTTVWYGVYDSVSNSTRWASSVYWKFGGSQAEIDYTPNPKAPKADFDVSPNPLYIDTKATLTNKSTDPQGLPLTYRWWYQKPGSTDWVEFSQDTNPNYVFNQKGQWLVYLRATNSAGIYSDVQKPVYVKNRAPKAGFTISPSSNTDRLSTVTFNSTASDPDGDSLTTSYEYRLKGNKDWQFMSNDANPSFKFPSLGTYEVRQTVTDTDGASDSVIQEVNVQNLLPTISLTYTPSQPYEGDTVNVCATVTDPYGQKLDVNIYETEQGSTEKLVSSKTQIASGSKVCYSFVAQNKRYDFRATVYNGYDQAQATTSIQPIPLGIVGHVDHTTDWLQKHQSLGHAADQFYSGEKFVLSADTSPYPVVYVKTTLLATQSDTKPIVRIVNLNGASQTHFIGELFDNSFLNYPTTIMNGPASFVFEVKYTNGVVKTDTVPIEIIDNIYHSFEYHRTN